MREGDVGTERGKRVHAEKRNDVGDASRRRADSWVGQRAAGRAAVLEGASPTVAELGLWPGVFVGDEVAAVGGGERAEAECARAYSRS